MSRFGWAFVSDIITGSGGTPGGSDKAIQFASGSSFSGSTNFTFDYTTNTVRLTGTLYADTLIVSSSTIFKSGSTKFGDDPTDTHQFTGSVLVSGSLTATNIITATSASFLDYVQLGTSLSDEVYFNASSKTNIQPATTNDVDLGASSRYWRTGYITTLSSSAISSSVSVKTGEITATAIVLNGNLSSSGNINGSGLQISGGGSFGSNVNVTGSVSASVNLQTAGDVTAGMNLTINNFANIKNGLTVTGSSIITGSLTVIGIMSASSLRGDGNNITGINGANVNGVGNDWTIQFKDGNTGTLTGSSGLTFSGSTLTLTGSFLMTGSSTFINIGPTILSGNLDVSGTVSASAATFNVLTASNSLVANTTTISNYAQFLPASIAIPTNQIASYIYTSGSTNDLYFTQYSGALENTTRLRWLEGSLGTGLQYGGLISTVTGTTAFNVSAGSGIIVTQNASTSSDPYPTIKQVNWSNYVSQSLLYSGSAQITYISIDTNGQVAQSITPPTLTQFKDRIVLGRVLHQSASVSNGTINSPTLSYAQTANIFDFIRSFGPLKISGHVLAASGSTLGITKTAGASYAEGRNYSADPDHPNIILASADPAITVTKIFRQYVSGSTTIILTNGNLGYTVVDPAQYNNNGTLSAVGNSEWTNQRVYWFPKSVNKALFVYYGTQKYGTELEAVAGLLTENFVEGENTLNAAIYVGSITLKGNETSLTSTNVSISQGGLFRAAGGGGGSTPPAGLTTEVQFNDGGAFGANSNFTYSSATKALTVNESITTTTSSFSRLQGQVTGNLAVDSIVSWNNVAGQFVSSSVYKVGSIGTQAVISASNGLLVTGSVTVSGNINITAGFSAGYTTYSSNTSIPNTSYFVGLNSVSSVLTASLLGSSNYPQGQTLIFKDIGGYAGTNNILVKASGSETIDGASGVSLTANSSSVSIISNGSNGFYIVGTV